MSIVTFDPDSVADVDFANRMRHPVAADASGGMWLSDTEPPISTNALRHGRLEKLRDWMAEAAYGAIVLFDPYNQRYATGRAICSAISSAIRRDISSSPRKGRSSSSNIRRAISRDVLDTIDEARPSKLVWSSVSNATRRPRAPSPRRSPICCAIPWRRVDEDRARPLQPSPGAGAREAGCSVTDCQGEILAVRAVKTPEEIKCLQVSMAGAEAAVAAVREAIRPGISRDRTLRRHVSGGDPPGRRVHRDPAAHLGPAHQSLVQRGRRPKVRPGELVALDTDMIGCYGYFSDFSRTFRCGPGRPTAYQKMLYRMAYDQIQHNIAIARPGMDIPRDRGKGLEDPGAFRRAALHLGDAWRRHAWRDALHRPCHGLRDLWPGRPSRPGHGGERGELYRRKGRPGGREARGRDPGHRDAAASFISRFPYEEDFLGGVE